MPWYAIVANKRILFIIMNENNNFSTINPYRIGIYHILNRLVWDLSIHSWISRHKLKALKNKYYGEKAIILCNGPSLLKSDLSLLEGIYTFGLNKINLLFNRNEFRPSCIVSINSFVIEQNKDYFNNSDIDLFLSYKSNKNIIPRKNIIYLHLSEQKKFAKNCSISIYPGNTVTYVAMQLAFHMGFNKIALIGCDHYFTTKGPPNKTVSSGSTDTNHFDPHYFANGAKWQLPDLLQSEVAYTLAKHTFERDGRQIYNCTEEGNLEIFRRISLKEFMVHPLKSSL